MKTPRILNEIIVAYRSPVLRKLALSTVFLRVLRTIIWLPSFLLMLPIVLWAIAKMILEFVDGKIYPVLDWYTDFVGRPMRSMADKIRSNIDAAHKIMPPEEISSKILKKKEQ